MKKQQILTVCVSKKTNKYSIRKDSYLFWTGFKTNNWVDEDKEPNKIWESNDKKLVYIICSLVEYSLVNNVNINDLSGNVMKYTSEEIEIAKKWFETNKYRSDMIADIYSYIEGMRAFAFNTNYNSDCEHINTIRTNVGIVNCTKCGAAIINI